MTRVTLIGSQTEYKLLSLVESVIDTTQDFTDSAYTSHDRRQRILMACEKLRHDLTVLIRVGISMRVMHCFRCIVSCEFIFIWRLNPINAGVDNMDFH